MTVQPFAFNVPQAELDDLQYRLARTRWPDEVEGADWEHGTNLGYLRELVDYWQHTYDWRTQEAALNAFAHYQAEIDGEVIQFIHERGKGPNPTPIMLLHGWPDSIYRYSKLIPLLTDPAAYGGDPNDSFDVIVPSLLDTERKSHKPAREQEFKQVAGRFWRLMTEELGYERFAAAGGDGGSPLAQLVAIDHPESIIGLHLTDLGFHVTMGQPENPSPAEAEYLQALEKVGYQEGAYAVELGTKPQTWAFGLHDSPVGWAALVIEKFRTWSDCDGDLSKRYTKDDLLTNIMLQWLTGIDPRGYREEWVAPSIKPDQAVDVPVAVALPPKDMNPLPPHEFAARNLKQIERWTVLAEGGHFAALEVPQLMADDLRSFFRELQAKG